MQAGSAKNPSSVYVNLLMGGVLMMGGAYGYLKARSVPSLVASLAFGAAFATTSYLISTGAQLSGHKAATITGFLLALLMGRRFLHSKKFMPAGLITVAALCTALFNANKWYIA